MFFKRDPDADPGLAGNVHVRHSTRPADMAKLKKLTKCGKFTGAVIVTAECLTDQLEVRSSPPPSPSLSPFLPLSPLSPSLPFLFYRSLANV